MDTDDVRFRRATANDLAAIVGMLADDPIGRTRERLHDDGTIDDAYVDALAAMDADPNQELVVVDAAADGVVVGCLQLTFIPGLSRTAMWRAQIESVRIARSHRGAGLGRRMFEWAIARARERGAGLVQLTTDKARPDAFKFYEDLGFVASHEGMKLTL